MDECRITEVLNELKGVVSSMVTRMDIVETKVESFDKNQSALSTFIKEDNKRLFDLVTSLIDTSNKQRNREIKDSTAYRNQTTQFYIQIAKLGFLTMATITLAAFGIKQLINFL